MDAESLPSSLTGRYRVGADLGGGSNAHVVRAYDTVLHREVAIKLLRSRSATPSQLAQQEREGQVLASLNHRALTTLHDVGVDRTDPMRPVAYLVMEYVDGPDLRRRLRAGELSALQACWLGHDLADALSTLHATGFLHRDVKPANVLLAAHEDGARLRGKLTDFGIASLASTPHTPGQVTGTAAYIAPEQVEDRPATPASDVYSLGLVLLEAVTGVRAYRGGAEAAALARLDRQPDIPDDLPEPLGALLAAMTARDPGSRPSAARAAARFHDLAVDELVHERGRAEPDADQEAARLAAVRRYGILDTPPEDAFDEVAALAARILHAPVALVSIIDRDRVWFKSRRDFAESELDRNTALCSLTAPGGRAWSITDAAADQRTRDNPLVLGGPRIRGYAAAPLRTHDGHDIGVLCVLDPAAHEFTADDLAILTSLAAVIMRDLELRLASRRAVFNRRAAEPARGASSRDCRLGATGGHR